MKQAWHSGLGDSCRGLRASTLVVLLLMSSALWACASMQPRKGSLDIVALRRAAVAGQDAELAVRLAEAEMFAPQGDAKRVPAQLAKARELAPDVGLVWLLSALHEDSHGEPERAFRALARGLPLLVREAQSSAEHEAGAWAAARVEFAMHALAGLEGSVAHYRERALALVTQLAPRLPAPARAAALELELDLRMRKGQAAAAQASAQRAGCLQAVAIAGPFGPRELLGFDQNYGVDPGAALASVYDLGPRRGRQATRQLQPHGCSFHLGGDPLGQGGTRFIQATLDNRGAESRILRVDTPNPFEIYIDGRSLLRVDRRTEPSPRAQYVPLTLSPGKHLLTIKLTSRHPNPVLSVSTAPATAASRRALELPEAQSEWQHFLRAAVVMSRGDVLQARRTLEKKVRPGEPVAPYLLVQRAAVALSDPLWPGDMADDLAGAWLERAVERDRTLWSPLLQLASFAANNGRIHESIEAIQGLAGRFPRVPVVGLTLARLLRSQGLDEAADQQLARVRRLVPQACAPLVATLSALLDHQREAAAAPVIADLMQCDARSNAHYQQLVRRRQWQQAAAERERLQALGTADPGYNDLLTAIELAAQQGDDAARAAAVAVLQRVYPRSEASVVEAVNLLAERGELDEARELLRAAVTQQPATMGGLWRWLPLLGETHPLSAYRRDGLAAIAGYEAAGHRYEGPQLLVFDYMALRLFEDGSSMELVHTVQQAQSDEAIDTLAEVSLPEGAEPLTLRVVKADGRLLEPDAIAGKDTISMPGMGVGDYVEIEYVRQLPPQEGFPEGYLGDRFFFSSFEVPFDHSELVVVAPAAIPLVVDSRGPAPTAQVRRVGELVERRFEVHQSSPLQQEPDSVSFVEYVPSVRVGVGAEWPDFVNTMREMLVDRSLRDPALQQDVEQLLSDLPPEAVRERAQRLYDWVLDEVENDSNDLFSQAALMLRARRGNRARVLQYVLELAGIPADLVLARSAAADHTPSELVDRDTYDHLLVRVHAADEPIWLFTAETHAPFGYMPSLLAGQTGIALSAEAPRLTVPPAPVGAELRVLDVQVALAADGNGELNVLERVHGAGAISWRKQLESVPEVELSRRFENEYAARLVPGATLVDLEISGRERGEQPLQLEYTLEVDGLARRTADGWALAPLFSAELAASYATFAERATALLTGSTVETQVRLHVHLPPGATHPAAAPAISLVGPGAGTFSRRSQWRDGVLLQERALRLPTMRIAPEDYPEFARFCRQVDEAEELDVRYGIGEGAAPKPAPASPAVSGAAGVAGPASE